MISILTYFILEEKRIGIRIGQYESSQQISCGFSKTKIRYFLSISNIYVLFQCVFIMTHNYDSLYFFCLFIFIGHYWLKPIFIGETNICVYLKITSSASSFNNPIYESFYMTHIIFIACSRSSTLLCAYAECLKSRIFASFITPVTFYLFSS